MPRSWLPVPGWDTLFPTERRGNLWNYDEVTWGLTECQRRGCGQTAELLADGLPLCLDCAEDLLERQAALVLVPRLAAMLPAWGEA